MNRMLALALATATLFGTAAAQTAAPTAANLAPPSAGLLYSYQYWPTQYIQWIEGTELPYSMAEFDVDNVGAKQPLYHCVLTGKDGNRTHYSNIDGIVAGFKAAGEPSYKTAIAFDSDETGKPGSTSTLRFTMQDGKPLEWRFVQGSDISAQGSGVTPLPQAPVPVFAYREEGAVAGEGTAIKIGDAVSIAPVWTEISKPPYFVGYRGAITNSAHMLVLMKGAESWKITKAPPTIAAGSTWELDGETGNHRTLTIDKTDGTHATISLVDRMHPLTRTVLTATHTADGWTMDSLRLSPLKEGDKHFMTLTFTAATPATGILEITAGKKTKVASASVEMSNTAGETRKAIKFTAPAWVAGKQVAEQTTTSPDTLVITTK
ncbi:MAG: hypothetical protein ACRYF4_11170 [Janthinobacterium lividum]